MNKKPPVDRFLLFTLPCSSFCLYGDFCWFGRRERHLGRRRRRSSVLVSVVKACRFSLRCYVFCLLVVLVKLSILAK